MDGADSLDFTDFVPTGMDVDSTMGDPDYVDMMDVLQSMGIGVVVAPRFINAVRRKPKGTVVELYCQGRMVVAAHGKRRSLKMEGLGAFD